MAQSVACGRSWLADEADGEQSWRAPGVSPGASLEFSGDEFRVDT